MSWSSWLPVAIEGSAQTSSMIGNNWFSRDVNEATRDYNNQMVNWTYSKNLEQWNRENTYNSPVEQRKRLEAAGLNPALMYGKAASPGIAGKSPEMGVPEGKFGGFDPFPKVSLISAYQDYKLKNLEGDKLASQIRLIENQADLNYFTAKIKELLGFSMWGDDGGESHKSYTQNSYIQDLEAQKLANELRKEIIAGKGWDNKWKKSKQDLFDLSGTNIDQGGELNFLDRKIMKMWSDLFTNYKRRNK